MRPSILIRDIGDETATVSIPADSYAFDDSEPDPLFAGRVLVDMPLDEAFWAVEACDIRACRGCGLMHDECCCCAHLVPPDAACPTCDGDEHEDTDRAAYERAHAVGW